MKPKTIMLMALLMPSIVLAEGYDEGVSYQDYGNARIGTDGSTATRIGNQTFYEGGSSSYNTGNQEIHSDGDVGIRTGNIISYPKGQTCTTISNQTICY